MLELKNIKKDYKLKDQEPVHALKGISLNFRANEFVAILGHSGCGKTTLLNITGGLDHYDDGDLIIKGRSTKDFKDADWDTYRNHSVGFVFQSYNLIPHQSIIKNVELALTISGISKEERIRRAKSALDLVGLEGLYKKKPNQLSGGQMQRVAIARALVNNPEIVLADEPTGALDSETSIQIMDLLKQVANNHLVIMVTHNPELAEKYASRIVRMKDGLITSDSNPYDGKEEAPVQEVTQVNKGKKKHSSMSFFTGFALSLSNLFSKLKRTILVSLAGSIGIIGVSTILGVSCGVNNFIDDMQNDMLSAYPITVAEESVDLTSLIAGLTTQEKKEIAKFDLKTQVGMDSMISYLLTKYTDFTQVKTNNITKTFLQYVEQLSPKYYAAVNYNYSIDPTNNFFTEFTKKNHETGEDYTEVISINGLTQQYIQTLKTVKGFGEYAQFMDLFTNFMDQLPAEKNYLLSQYDLIGNSRFPTKDNELLLVVDNNQTLTDLVLAQLGYYPQEEFLNVAKRAIKLNELKKEYEDPESHMSKETYERKKKEIIAKYPYNAVFNIEDILNHKFYYVPHQDLYVQGSELVSHKQINVNLSGQISTGGSHYVSLDYIPESDTLSGKAVEVIDNKATMHTVIAQRMSEADRKTTTHSEIDGTWVYIYADMLDAELLTALSGLSGASAAEIAALIQQYPQLLQAVHLAQFASENPQEVGERKYQYTCKPDESVISSIFGIPSVTGLTGEIVQLDPETPDYSYKAVINPNEVNNIQEVSVVGILKPKESTMFGTLSRGVYFTKQFTKTYMADAEASDIVTTFKDHIEKFRYKESTFNVYVEFKYDDYSEEERTGKINVRDGYANALNGDTASALTSIFASFLSNGSDNLKTDKLHLRAIAGLKANDITDEEDASIIVKHEIIDVPQSIGFYPKSFETKDKVTNHLKRWNKNIDLKIGGVNVPKSEREEITYTDTISAIVEIVSTLVTTVSIALIAFTSLSLVVSCFMIAVITYISVMERIKEIGVIRSLGGRKRDVSTLFISENLITGFASGAIGIIFTYILQLIINAIVAPFGVNNICALPFLYALLMIGLSILLSIISGLIPSLGASKQDPVVALRSE